MALVGQGLGQTSPGSKLWALACPLNARGYTKHTPQSSVEVFRARQRTILFRKWCVISLCSRPERGLSRGSRYVGTAGWVQVCLLVQTSGSPTM